MKNVVHDVKHPRIDSKTVEGKNFLMMIAQELEIVIHNEMITSWELVDLIIKDIYLRKDVGRRLRAENKRLNNKLQGMKSCASRLAVDLFIATKDKKEADK